MRVQQILEILNWAGVGTAALTIILIVCTFRFLMKIHPKALKRHIKELQKPPEAPSFLPIRRIVELTVPTEAEERLAALFPQVDNLQAGWHRSGQEEAL